MPSTAAEAAAARYRIEYHRGDIFLRRPDDGGYLVRQATLGHLESMFLSPRGGISHRMVSDPESFLRSRPELVSCPGIPEALRTLAYRRDD